MRRCDGNEAERNARGCATGEESRPNKGRLRDDAIEAVGFEIDAGNGITRIREQVTIGGLLIGADEVATARDKACTGEFHLDRIGKRGNETTTENRIADADEIESCGIGGDLEAFGDGTGDRGLGDSSRNDVDNVNLRRSDDFAGDDETAAVWRELCF